MVQRMDSFSDLDACKYNVQHLVGYTCNTNSNITITSAYAEVVLKILQGPRTTTGRFIWYGLPHGGDFLATADSTTIKGKPVPTPYSLEPTYIQCMVFRDPNYNTTNMSYTDFEIAFQYSLANFSQYLGSDNPHLSEFHSRGGKTISWQGLADQIVTPHNTMRYLDQLSVKMGGNEIVDEFLRLYYTPGVGHCGGGTGPVPVDPFQVLVDWVEKGVVPGTLAAETTMESGVSLTRNLCRYPMLLNYDGKEDVNAASSFFCVQEIRIEARRASLLGLFPPGND